MHLAVCTFSIDGLLVEDFVPLKAKKKDDFSAFEEWLRCDGKWGEVKEWLAGIDFPFGMPVEAIEHFGWLVNAPNLQTWQAYMSRIETDYKDAGAFRQCIEGWRHPTRTNERGQPIRIRKQRLTDKLARSGSPMNYFPPPVCPMFFRGAKGYLMHRPILASNPFARPIRLG
jgi:hypothetical protein